MHSRPTAVPGYVQLYERTCSHAALLVLTYMRWRMSSVRHHLPGTRLAATPACLASHHLAWATGNHSGHTPLGGQSDPPGQISTGLASGSQGTVGFPGAPCWYDGMSTR